MVQWEPEARALGLQTWSLNVLNGKAPVQRGQTSFTSSLASSKEPWKWLGPAAGLGDKLTVRRRLGL